MLRLIVFVAGAVLMALEIVGSRLVAPQFGSSIFVWGSLISVFLAGLSAGYYAGGRLADRWPSHGLLACLFVPPAAWILALPLAAPPLGEAVLAADLGPQWGPLVVTTLLFLVPSICLGLISPFAIRLAARSIATVGNTAGVLYAVSTAGSIVGTLGAAFFLIPSFGTRAIVYGLGASLLALAGLAALDALRMRHVRRVVPLAAADPPARLHLDGTAVDGSAGGRSAAEARALPGLRPPPSGEHQGGRGPCEPAGRGEQADPGPRGAGGSPGGAGPRRVESRRAGRVPGGGPTAVVALLALAAAVGALLVSAAFGQERVLYEKDSAYHRIIVYEEGGSRILRFNQSRQSGMYLDDPYRLRFLYTDYTHLAFVFKPNPASVCIIGLGGGSVPKKYRRDYPSLRIDVAEIDPEVVDVAKRFFYFKEDPLMRVAALDGRVFLTRQRDARYDFVFVDAYYSDAIPFHMTTVEFLNLVKRRLSPDGIVAWNIIGTLDGPRSRLFRSVYKTFRTAFPQVYVFPVGGEAAFEGGAMGNLIVVGTPSMARLSREAFIERARGLEASGTIKAPVGRYASTYYTRPILTDDVPVLTDDYAPVDSLLHF